MSTSRDDVDDGETFSTLTGQLVLAGVCGVVAVSVWSMVVLSRPARAERLLRIRQPVHSRAVAG